MKSLILFKRVVTAFFIVLFSPIVSFLRFIFIKILIKLYLGYFSFIKKIGWTRFSGGVVSFLFSQKTVHILVFVLTFSIIFTSFVGRGRAKTMTERANKTIISELVRSEFYEFFDDELIEEGFSEEAISAQVQLKYLNSLASIDKKPRTALREEEEESLSSLSNPSGEAITKPEITITKISKKARKEIIEYEVQSGDTISTIAFEFDISVNTILWENNLSSYSLIRPGDTLTILQSSGLSHKVVKGNTLGSLAKKYKITEEEIMKANKMTESSKLSIGDILFIPGGKKVYYATPAKNTSYNPISIIKDIVKPAGTQAAPSNKMAWPTEGARITQYYSWRHHGLDIANKTGIPVYAADAGSVTYAGWKNGYGYTLIVDHGGGKQTLYAHLSKFYVAKGQRVGKGESIAAMGSTGWSTGPHLHFEVRIGGKKYNPLNYIR